MVEAAQTYIDAELGTEYPSAGDKCVYCLQPLEASALELVRKYAEFLSGEKKAAVRKAEDDVAANCKELVDLELERLCQDVQAKVDAAGEGVHSSLTEGAAAIAELWVLQRTVTGRESLPAEGPAFEEVSSTVEGRIAELRALVEDLQGAAETRKDLLDDAKAKLRDLTDRLTLRELLPDIRTRVENAKWASKASTIGARLKQVERSLTEESKAASAALLNQDFEERFFAECEELRAPKVTLKFPGKDANPGRRKTLAPKIRLRKVLSEGEQKVVALADFLAEAELRRSPAPMVFDDPVTSLDYRRIDYVVKRIVELSAERQVIVFTHNIMLTMKLLEPFERMRESCTYYDVRDEEGKRGLVAEAHSPQLDTWGDRKKRVEERIRWAKDESNPEKRQAWVVAGYESLRARAKSSSNRISCRGSFRATDET